MPHPAFQRHPVGCGCCFEFHCVLHARCQRGARESCCHGGSGAQWQVSRRKRWKPFALLVGGILPFSKPKDPQRLFMNSHLFLLSFIICICSSISSLYLYLNLHQYQYLSELDMLIHFLNLHLYMYIRIYIYILSIFIKFPNGSHGYRPGLLWRPAAGCFHGRPQPGSVSWRPPAIAGLGAHGQLEPWGELLGVGPGNGLTPMEQKRYMFGGFLGGFLGG